MNATATAAKVELLAPGARLGRYHLLERLAIGGMAELHIACAEGVAGFQKVVVLKRVLPNLAQDADFIALFVNEARLAANLDHPNLVQVMDIGHEGGEYFYVMEYVHGVNVREVLAEASKRGRMPLDVAVAIVMAVATGLHHAHERTDLDGAPLGLVHRDVSPANVLVSYDGGVKVTDFGIAKASARTTETIGGALKGKIGYMSPEQCRGEPVDRRSDVFALGILLFELTTTERLFYADNDFAILNKVLQGKFEPPSQRVADYPEALEDIVLQALAPSPDDRFATAEQMLRALETFVHDAHLRCSTGTIAEWMRGVFGQPPFPRVEILPPRPDDPLERIPTLVLAGDSMAGADPDAITRYEPPAPATVAAPPIRRRTPAIVAALAVAALGIGAAAWWSSRDPAPSHDPAAAPSTGAPTAAAMPSPPDAADGPRPAADPAEAGATPKVANDAAADEPPVHDDTARHIDDDRSMPAPAPSASPSKIRKSRRPPKKKRADKTKSSADLDALYPVKG